MCFLWVGWGHASAISDRQRSKDNVQESALPFHHAHPKIKLRCSDPAASAFPAKPSLQAQMGIFKMISKSRGGWGQVQGWAMHLPFSWGSLFFPSLPPLPLHIFPFKCVCVFICVHLCACSYVYTCVCSYEAGGQHQVSSSVSVQLVFSDRASRWA